MLSTSPTEGVHDRDGRTLRSAGLSSGLSNVFPCFRLVAFFFSASAWPLRLLVDAAERSSFIRYALCRLLGVLSSFYRLSSFVCSSSTTPFLW